MLLIEITLLKIAKRNELAGQSNANASQKQTPIATLEKKVFIETLRKKEREELSQPLEIPKQITVDISPSEQIIKPTEVQVPKT